MTPEIQRLRQKIERLKAKRDLLPAGEESVALNSEIKSVADQIALRVAVAQRATEHVGDSAEWAEMPPEDGAPEVVDLRGGKTVHDHLRQRDGRVPRRPPHAP